MRDNRSGTDPDAFARWLDRRASRYGPHRSRKRSSALGAEVRRMGLEVSKAPSGLLVHGTTQGCRVEGRLSKALWTFSVTARWSRVEVSARPQTVLSVFVEGSDLRLGDPAFDDQVHVRGPEPFLRAVLDGSRRGELLHWLGRGAVVEEGVAKWTLRDPERSDLRALPDLMRLCRGLTLKPSRIAGRLAEVAADRREPDAVRLGAATARVDLQPEVLPTLDDAHLIGLLGHRAHQLGALAVLGRRAGPDRVPAIADACSGLWVSRALREAGRQAVADIEARAVSQRGQLSVARDGGELSEAVDGGGLSEGRDP